MMRFILLLAIFFGFLGFGQVRPLTPEDVPEDVKKVVDCSFANLCRDETTRISGWYE